MIKELRIKLVCVNMVIVAIMLALLLSTLIFFLRRSIENQRFNELHRIAVKEDDAGLNTADDGNGYARLPYFTLKYGEDGTLQCSGDSSYDLSDKEWLKELYRQAGAAGKTRGVLPDYDLRFARAETKFGPKFVFTDMSLERATASRMIKIASLVGIVFFAIMLSVSVALAAWAVYPVSRAWKQQKQFVADVSHELKTPLTVIVSNAELLQQPGYSEAQRSVFNENILTMTKQMRHLVDSMLVLARVESVRGKEGREDLDFSALVEDCILPFEPLFFERALTFESEIEPGLRIHANDQGMRRCVDILLDNTQKYSEPGVVKLCLRRAGRYAELTIANPCTEMKKSECREVFRRFYRRDEARTRSGSYGLGLPIAEGIVKRCGGKIVCTWEAGEICFTVMLPLIKSVLP